MKYRAIFGVSVVFGVIAGLACNLGLEVRRYPSLAAIPHFGKGGLGGIGLRCALSI